nr:venom polypeptide precursor [Doratifera vulnerans]
MNFKVLGFVLLFIFFYAYAPVDKAAPKGAVARAGGGALKPVELPKHKNELE